jgi:hypothetical protein
MTTALKIGMRSKGADTDIVKVDCTPILRAIQPHLSKKGILKKDIFMLMYIFFSIYNPV